MAMVDDNQGKLNCNPVQFRRMATKVHTVSGKRFKLIFRGASEGNLCGNTVNGAVDHEQRAKVTNRGSKQFEGNVAMKESMLLNFRKRKPGTLSVGQMAKKQKIDCSLRLHLRKILKELLNHHTGWLFSEPVDPVKLNIPDYFEIITKPMDLGTILRKLEGNMYSGADEFTADVRLTFSNAMLYNPPWNEVHHFAKMLDAMFSKRLESLQAKLKNAKKNDGEARVIDFMESNGQEEKNDQRMKPIGLNSSPLPIKHGTCRLMSLKEKQMFKAQPGKIRLTSLNKGVEKVSAKQGQSIDSSESGSSCVSLKGHHLRTGAAQGFASDRSSERSEEQSHCADSKLEHRGVECPSGSRTSGCVLESDGPVVVNEENSFHLSTSTSAEEDFWTCNIPLSPKKALRAAKLKSRFADTIFKATHQELLNHNKKSDPLRLQQEREQLEREKQKEKDKIAAQIKAAEAASRRREQDAIKMRIRERNAARIALQKLEKSVELDGNVGVSDDLKMLGCGYLYYPWEAIHHGNRLKQLGLFCKVDFLEDVDDAILNIEEGEIIS